MIKLSDSARFPTEPLGTMYWVRDGGARQKRDPLPDLPVGRWHQAEVTVAGDRLTAILGGKPVWDARLDPDTSTHLGIVPALKRAKGRIGFQAHTGTVRFRKVEIKEPPPEFVTLFNGKDLTGWTHPPEHKGKAWVVNANRELIGDGASGNSVLTTTRDTFTNFRLKLFVKNIDDSQQRLIIRATVEADILRGYSINYGGTKGPVGGKQLVGSIFQTTNGSPVSGVPSTLLTRAEDTPNPVGHWYNLEIAAIDDRITVSVDGKQVAECTDSLFRAGHIRLFCRPGTTACVKNVGIIELPTSKPKK